MSKRSVKSVGKGSSAGGGKGAGGKKATEKCSQCDKPHKDLRLLPCSHSFCPTCLKTLVKVPAPAPEKGGGRTSRASQKGKAPKEEYECAICNKPKEPEVNYGDCAPCKFEEKTSPAVGFCVECAELLCEGCCGEHNKFKTIRAHTILKGDKIPKDTGAVARLPLLMMCMTHTEKDLEYFCADHNIMLCSACLNLGHRRCERVMFIKDIADEPTDRRAVADAAVELREVKKNFEEIHKDTGDIVANLEQQRNTIREKRENFRNNIMEMLDKLDQSSELEMEEVIQKVSKDMGDDTTSSKEILDQIESSVQILDAAAAHATEMQMFVAGRRSTADREKYVNILNNAMGSIQNVQMDFRPDPTLERMIKGLEMFNGRTISTSKQRHGQKPQNFRPEDSRPGTTLSGRFSRYSEMPSSNLPAIGPGHMVSGSVADFRSVGLRPNQRGMEPQSRYERMSLPPSPRRYDYDTNFLNTRSVPATPKIMEINRLPVARTSYNQTAYENQMFESGALPIISNRGPQSEPGFNMGRQQAMRDFAPASPRTVGNNSLVNQGLNRPVPVSRTDLMAATKPQMQRRPSLTSITTNQTLEGTIAGAPSRAAKSDILASASPIKRRSELNSSVLPLRERKAVFVGQFNVRLPGDANTCGLKGSAFMQDGRIALADYDNHCVKVFDSKLYRGIRLSLSSGPWDVEVTGPKELAVTLPFESKIQFVSVGEDLKTTRAIKLDMDCYGLVCRNQELIVVCNDYLIGPAIQIVSMTGRVKQTIDTDREGARLLVDPFYLTVTPTGKLIYVSDKDRIVCLDRHGNITSVYQETSLRNARGIDLDNEGNLYVCGYMSNNVLQITMHGIDFRCLISKDQVWDPWSVRFNEVSGSLLITSDNADMVKVFSLQ